MNDRKISPAAKLLLSSENSGTKFDEATCDTPYKNKTTENEEFVSSPRRIKSPQKVRFSEDNIKQPPVFRLPPFNDKDSLPVIQDSNYIRRSSYDDEMKV